VRMERERGDGVLRTCKIYEWATTLCGDRNDVCFHTSCPLKQSVLLISSAETPPSDLWSSHDIHVMMGSHQLLVTLLYAGCVAEGDRRAWFESFVDCFFGKGHTPAPASSKPWTARAKSACISSRRARCFVPKSEIISC